MGLSQVLKRIDAFPKIIDIEVNKTFSGAICKWNRRLSLKATSSIFYCSF